MPQAPTLNFDGIPEAQAATPGAKPSTTKPAAAATSPATPDMPGLNFDGIPPANRRAIMTTNDPVTQVGRSLYGALPQIGAAAGTALASAPFILGAPATVGASAFAAPMAGMVGAGAGAMLGRGGQWIIDRVLGRDPLLQNPRGAGEEATREMMTEVAGQAVALPARLLKGSLAPTTADAAERLATSKQFGLGMSTPEITGGGMGKMVQSTIGARGVTGRGIQQKAQDRTASAATKAVDQILDRVGRPGGTLAAGEQVKDAVGTDVARATSGLDANLSATLGTPRTGTQSTGAAVKTGVQASRDALRQQGAKLGELVKDGPDVDIREVKSRALGVLRDEIMPYLERVPAEGPNTPEFKKLMQLYKSGALIDVGPETRKLLEEAALDKSTFAPLRLINKILTASDLMPFPQAAQLNTGLREAGKGTELIASDKAEALASLFQKDLRGIMGTTHPTWDAASSAYGPNAQLFQSRFLQNLIDKDPEAVLASVTGKTGRTQASRAQALHQTLVTLPKEQGTPEQVEAGQRAFDTIRSEWLRREVIQDDPFGITKRIAQVDPDVIKAWFPELRGQDAMTAVIRVGRQYESKLLADIAQADPAQVVDLISRTPSRVAEARAKLTQAPYSPELWNRVKRSWVEQTLIPQDISQLGARLAKADPDMIAAWLPPPRQGLTAAENATRATDQSGLEMLRRLGRALEVQTSIPKRGTFEGVEAVSISSALITGNLGAALSLAAGFEGVPALVSKAMYSPALQRYLLEAADPAASYTTKTAALLRAAQAFRAAGQAQGPQEPPQQ